MHLCGDGADYRAHKSCNHTVAEAVLSRNGTKARRECQAVDIRLGRQGPRNVKAHQSADDDNEDKECDVSHGYGENVPDMLSVSGECERGEDYSRGCTGKSYARGQAGKDGRDNEYEIEIREYSKAVYGDIDHTDRHTELVGKISTVSRTFQKLAIAADASLVEDKSDGKGHGKQKDKEHVHKSAIAVRKRVVAIVYYRQISRLSYSESAVHKRVEKYTENTDGKSCFIEAVAVVHSRCAGQKRGDDKADGKSAHKRERRANPVYVKNGEAEIVYSVSEAQLAHEWRQCGREKCDMNVLAYLLFRNDTVKKYTDKWRPHIEEVQAVEAMRNHEHISREDGGISPCAAEVYDEVGTQAANRRIEERASESAERKIIGNKLTR